jgi:hypothetical protein
MATCRRRDLVAQAGENRNRFREKKTEELTVGKFYTFN